MNNEIIEEIDEEKIVNNIRCLGIDMINEAGSGHPGIVLGAAPILYTLYANHLNFDRENPDYFNRDRFIMSAGHGSALLYSTLYMAGFDITLDDLKKFRQIDSITPGHPEYKTTPGVEMTTGPLGQGIATAVGIAMGEAHQEALLNDSKNKLIDYYTYVLCGDGDLMEGVTNEALSLAGTLKLNKLIVLYDSNNISLDGSTDLAFTENISMKFTAMGFNVLEVDDGENIAKINEAIELAKKSTDKPTLIEIKTVIGKYSKYQGTNTVHGMPLTEDDITSIKTKLNIRDIPFTVSTTVIDDFKKLVDKRCHILTDKFNRKIEKLDAEKKEILNYLMNNDKKIPLAGIDYEAPDTKSEAVRDTSSKVLNSLVSKYPYIFGGSADLFGATKVYIDNGGDFSSKDYASKNIYFGVREHAMGSILNGLALVGFRPYGSTFLSFADYLKPAIRMACLMHLPITYIFTHDSISVGEDGATHEPVEQLEGLRCTPNLEVFRPADANEVIGVYKTIMEKSDSPSVISLSRNALPIFETTKVNDVANGAYIVRHEVRSLDGILIASGEEVSLAMEVANNLSVKGIDLRVVSVPCLNRFLNMNDEYYEELLPVEKRKIVISTEVADAWYKIVWSDKYLITLNSFGASGKKDDVYKKYGFDIPTLEKKVENLLK